jgi:polyribonucleotide nucleotidyltransferase
MTINREKIREVIGTGGKVIREICETTGAKIDIDEDGSIRIYAVNAGQANAAKNWIVNIVAEPEVGAIYDGKVVTIVDFGAFVNFIGNQEGLVHVSEITGERIADVNSVLKVGDLVKVKLVEMDSRGKSRLSMRAVNQETGEEIALPESDGGEKNNQRRKK